MKNEYGSKYEVSAPHSSVKREIFQSSAVLALIIVAVFGLFLSVVLYYSEVSKARAVISRTNSSVALFIDSYFEIIKDTITVLEGDQEIRNAMSGDEKTRQRILNSYRLISKTNQNITYLYSGYQNGLMLINDYTPPERFNPTTRPWYQAAMAAKPEISIGVPYQEVKTNEWLISTGRALQQPDGHYGGVVAIDCSMGQIIRLLARHDDYQTEYSFVMDRSGKIIMHPDQSLVGKLLQDTKEAFQQDNKGYVSAKSNSFIQYSRIASTGWTVVTVVEKREIIRPIVSQVVLLVGLSGLIAVVLGSVQSVQLSRRLSRPLVELDRKLKAVIAGGDLAADEYIYPNNEIGVMAREIGRLAEKEINAKSRELQASKDIYKAILIASPDNIVIADLAGQVIMVSEIATTMFGYSPGEELGMSIMDFIVPEDHQRVRDNMEKLVQGEKVSSSNEYRAIRKDRFCFDIEVNSALIRDQQGKPARMVLIARDITNRKKADLQIQQLVHQLEIERDQAQQNSLTDSMTGLYNRRFFDKVLWTEFSMHKRSGMQLSLIMIDVDHFKRYNDHYGHLEGDKCLQQIANTLKNVVERAHDIVARYGGEEFVIILPDTDRQGAIALAGLIGSSVQRLALPHATSGVSDFVTISLGVASAADHELSDAAELVELADQALYAAKKNGRNRYELATPAM